MGWPADFRAKLAARTLAPIFAIQAEDALDVFTSAPIAVGSLQTARPWLDISALTFGKYGVQPIEWAPESGAWRFAVLAGPPAWGRREVILRALGRGTVVRLRMGFPGDPWTSYQIVGQGRIAGLEIRPDGGIVCEVWDIVAALAARWTGGGDLRTEAQLFSRVRPSTTLTSAYTPGDTTLAISDAEPDATREIGAMGAVKISPVSGAAPFYVRFTSSSTGPNRLTGVTTGVTFGTTPVVAGLGSAVEYVPLVFGTIPEVVCKVLTSSGGASGGAYDVLPVTWGYGLRDGVHVDVSDITGPANAALTAMAGGGNIEVVVDPDPVDSGEWLRGILAPYGAFLTVRQGLITLRCAQDIRPTHASITLGLRAGVAPEQVDGSTLRVKQADWANLTYGIAAVKDTSGTTAIGSPVRSYPSAQLRVYDVSASLWSSASAVRAATVARLAPWAAVLGELIEAEVAGLDCWDLCPGDIVRWTYPHTGGLYLSTIGGWSARLALVVSVQPDPLRGMLTLSLGTLPDDAADRLEV